MSTFPERKFSIKIRSEFPKAIDLRKYRPDFYDPEQGFIELKIARKNKTNDGFNIKNGGNFDRQLEEYPRPLTVIVLDESNGEELARFSISINDELTFSDERSASEIIARHPYLKRYQRRM